MKTHQRNLLAIVLFIVGFSLLTFSVRANIDADEQLSLISQSVEVSNQFSEMMPQQIGIDLQPPAIDNDEMKLIASVTGPISLSTMPIRIPLVPATTTTKRIYIVLKNLRAVKQPGVLYHLYLDLPPETKPSKDDARYIGTLNFFNRAGGGGFGAPKTSSFDSYDITAAARNLQARNLLYEDTTITIIPAGEPDAEARPTIGLIELVEQCVEK
jgi:hypothetical protein